MLYNFIEKARAALGRSGASSSATWLGQFGFNVLNQNGTDVTARLFKGVRPDNEGFAWGKNRVVDQGLNYIMNAALRGEGVLTTFYIAPFAANVTPAANLTAATFAATTTEFTNYDEANRVAWVTDAAASALVLVNDAAPSLFTIGAGAQTTIYGAGLLSAQGKSATTGVLVAAARLGTALTGLADDFEVRLKYRITGSSS